MVSFVDFAITLDFPIIHFYLSLSFYWTFLHLFLVLGIVFPWMSDEKPIIYLVRYLCVFIYTVFLFSLYMHMAQSFLSLGPTC